MSDPRCPTSTLTIARGQKAVATISFTNNGTLSYNFYVIIVIGDYDPSTDTWSGEYGVIGGPISLAPGASQQVHLEWIIPQNAKTGYRDVIAAIIDYDPSTQKITNVFDGTAPPCNNILNVS